MSQKRANRVYVLGCNFRSGWNFDMGSSSMESWDDSLSWWVRSNSTYLHSKGVKNARKHKLSKISSVINEPWSQWWRHHDVIKWGLSLTPCHHWYQVSWRSDEKQPSYYARKPRIGRFRPKSVSRDPCDDVIMTSLNRVHPYPPRNSPVKFHQDPTRNGWVIVLTRKCPQTTDDRRRTTDDRHYDNNTPRFAEG